MSHQQESVPQLSLPARGYRLLKQLGIFVASCITAAVESGKTAALATGRGLKTAALATGKGLKIATLATGRFCRRASVAVWHALCSPVRCAASAIRVTRSACREAKENGTPAVLAGWQAFTAGTKRNHVRLKSYFNHAIALAGILVFAAVSIGCSRLSFAVEVTCDGAVIGYVEDETVYQEACRLLNERLQHADATSLSLQPGLQVVLHQKSGLLSATALTDSLLRVSGNEVQEAVGIYLNNDFLGAAAEQATAEDLLADYTASFRTDPGAEISVRESVSFLPGYYLTDDILETAQLSKRLNAPKEDGSAWLHVVQTTQVVEQKEIPFPTEEQKNAELLVGTRQTTQKGANGVSQVITAVTTENGVETARKVLTAETVTEPVTQIVAVGTKQPEPVSYAPSLSAGSATYIWPVNGGYTSAHYGDGRNHKGEDIAAPAGTHIYASRSGTVIRAGWYSGYGLCVMIDHGDGVVTLYGHASRLNVSEGQQVGQGDVIAFVGTTGESTGNHCHFEIRVNGTCINPENYIGSRSR